MIDTFRAVPAESVCVRPVLGINAPGSVFAHTEVTEQKHVEMFLQGRDDVPESYRIYFERGRWREQNKTTVELMDALIACRQEVREKMRTYLDGISDADLGRRWLSSS